MVKTAQVIENTFERRGTSVAHVSGPSMDVQRPDLADVKRMRRLLLAGTGTVHLP